MDPRGALEEPLSDPPPFGALERLAAASRDGFPHLLRARARTAARLAALQDRLSPLARDDDASIVLFGSWGRSELTFGSDDDWAVLVAGPERAAIAPPADAVAGILGADEERKPGTQGIFGGVVFGEHLVGRIGLDADDNRNLTRRMLLLLESVAVVGEPAYRRAWQRVLDGYLADSLDDFRPPRFFLNDVIRYWRTICVDFVGKDREQAGMKWAARNAKLRTSRKLLFAGGLLPILQCHRHLAADMGAFLAAQLAAPPTDRLAHAFLEHDAVDAGVRALGAYDRWVGLLDDPLARAQLNALSRAQAGRSPVFREARRCGADLEAGLLALLFETALHPLVREYGIF